MSSLELMNFLKGIVHEWAEIPSDGTSVALLDLPIEIAANDVIGKITNFVTEKLSDKIRGINVGDMYSCEGSVLAFEVLGIDRGTFSVLFKTNSSETTRKVNLLTFMDMIERLNFKKISVINSE